MPFNNQKQRQKSKNSRFQFSYHHGAILAELCCANHSLSQSGDGSQKQIDGLHTRSSPKMRTTILCFGAAFGLLMSVLPASALSLSTDASYTVDTTSSGTVSDQDGPYTSGAGDLFSSVFYGGGIVEVGGGAEGEGEGEGDVIIPQSEELGSFGDAFGYAADSGALSGGAFLSSDLDINSMDFHGSSSWSDTFTNTTGGSADFAFDFFFAGGNLSLSGNGGEAGFNLDILLDGDTIWNGSAGLSGNPSVEIPTLTTNLDDYLEFGLGSSASVDFDPFSDSLDLGQFAAGETFTVTYNLDVWASTSDPSSHAEARVGDPFNVGFSGGVNAPTAPIPEPTSMALLGMGIVGLAARARGSKRQA